jgi:hypothetical protein
MSSIIASPESTRLRLGRRAALALATSALAAGVLSTQAQADATSPPDASANYAYQTIDNPQDLTFNQLLGINDSGTIAGYFGSGQPGHPNKGYVIPSRSMQSRQFDWGRTSQPSFVNENFPGSAQTQVTGLNNTGATVGFWADAAGDNFGFYKAHGQYHIANFPTSNVASPSFDQLLGVNDFGLAVGVYADGQGINHGYLYDIRTHRYAQLPDPAGDTNVTAAAINDRGCIAGFGTNAAGNTEGFLRRLDGQVIHLDVPGATTTQATGVNNRNEVVGNYTVVTGTGTSASTMTYGFVWSQDSGFQTVNDPNGVGATTINGVNDRGQVVGFYTDSNGNADGFVGRPQD